MNIKWDSEEYKKNFSFVPFYGEDVLSLITVGKGERALDLGCGNGNLTSALEKRGFSVIGIDQSDDMLSLARKDYPDIEFRKGDALTFSLEKKADLIFSNAVFHWIDEERQDDLMENISRNLKRGGELVFEMGGKGCAESVHSTLEKIFKERGLLYRRTFFFPAIGEYAPIIERHGLKIDYAILFDRPTVQSAKDGLASWIRMFDSAPFEGLNEKRVEEIIREAEKRLEKRLFIDGRWTIDYVRLRMRAHRF